MDKYKRYTGLIIFIIAVALMLYAAATIIIPQYNNWTGLKDKVSVTTQNLEAKRQAKANIIKKLKKMQESVLSSQKKIYSPVESKLGNDTLFFTLYSDVIEMVRANTIKIKSIDYKYNPKGDVFVQQNVQQKDSMYFVCDVNMEVVSNYVNLGKLIQDLYQYPYYIKINSIEVVPYYADKKILLSTISLRLYAHTSPDKDLVTELENIDKGNGDTNTLNNATKPLPQ